MLGRIAIFFPSIGSLAKGFVLIALLMGSALAAPVDVRNQHPVQLTAIHAPARASVPLETASSESGLHYDLTSLWALVGRGADRFEQDGETSRLEFWHRLALPYGDNIDLEFRLSALYASGGMMDSTIEAWHRFWGLPQNRRDDAQRDQFVISAKRLHKGQRETIYALEADSVQLMDLPIFLTGFPRALALGSWRAGWRAGFEIPVGDARAGAGSGGFDTHLGALFGGPGLGGRIDFWAGYAWVHTPRVAESANLRYQNPLSAGFAYQKRILSHTEIQLQSTWEQSLLGNLRDPHARRDQWLVWLGIQQRISASLSWEFAFSEDLVPDVSPDITFHLGLRWHG